MRYDALRENGRLLAAVRQVIDRKSGSPSDGTFSRARWDSAGVAGAVNSAWTSPTIASSIGWLDSMRTVTLPLGKRTSVPRTSRPGLARSASPSSCRFEPRVSLRVASRSRDRPPAGPCWLSVRAAFRAPGGLDTGKVVARFARGRAFSPRDCPRRPAGARHSGPAWDGGRWPG